MHEQVDSSSTPSATLKARLRWRCRRGMAEMDQLLLRFLDHDFDELSPQQQTDFDHLLNMEDDQLWACFLRRQQAAQPAQQQMIERILASADV